MTEIWLTLIAAFGVAPASGQESQTIAVVIGAAGAAEYEEPFLTWADRWRQAAQTGNVEHVEIGRTETQNLNDRERLRQFLADQHEPSNQPLWLVFIGHGTYYRELAKFNLRGPDVSADDLAAWLQPIKRPLVLVNCASSSGPFLNELSGPQRIIITATKDPALRGSARVWVSVLGAVSMYAKPPVAEPAWSYVPNRFSHGFELPTLKFVHTSREMRNRFWMRAEARITGMTETYISFTGYLPLNPR